MRFPSSRKEPEDTPVDQADATLQEIHARAMAVSDQAGRARQMTELLKMMMDGLDPDQQRQLIERQLDQLPASARLAVLASGDTGAASDILRAAENHPRLIHDLTVHALNTHTLDMSLVPPGVHGTIDIVAKEGTYRKINDCIDWLALGNGLFRPLASGTYVDTKTDQEFYIGPQTPIRPLTYGLNVRTPEPTIALGRQFYASVLQGEEETAPIAWGNANTRLTIGTTKRGMPFYIKRVILGDYVVIVE